MRRFSRARRAETRRWTFRSRSRNGIFVGKRTEVVGGGLMCCKSCEVGKKNVADLLSGRSDVQRARRVFLDVYCALHHGSCAFPTFQVFEVFGRLLFVVVHTQCSPTPVSSPLRCCPTYPSLTVPYSSKPLCSQSIALTNHTYHTYPLSTVPFPSNRKTCSLTISFPAILLLTSPPPIGALGSTPGFCGCGCGCGCGRGTGAASGPTSNIRHGACDLDEHSNTHTPVTVFSPIRFLRCVRKCARHAPFGDPTCTLVVSTPHPHPSSKQIKP